MAKGGVKREIEELINGGTVAKKVNEELTYRDLYNSIENLWSVLFTTGVIRLQCLSQQSPYQIQHFIIIAVMLCLIKGHIIFVN